MKKSWIIALSAVVLAVIALTGWAAVRVFREFAAGGVVAAAKSTTSGAQDGADEDKNSKDKVIRLVSNPSPMPPFLVNDLEGNLISTATLHGKIVLLAFWATWCPPCREEIPELNELAKRYPNQLVVIGVSQDDGPASDVRAFAQKIGMHYPIVMGSREMSDEYGGVPALPTTFVV